MELNLEMGEFVCSKCHQKCDGGEQSSEVNLCLSCVGLKSRSLGDYRQVGHLWVTHFNTRGIYVYRVGMTLETINAINEAFPDVFKNIKLISRMFYEVVVPADSNKLFFNEFKERLIDAGTIEDKIKELRLLKIQAARVKEIETELKSLALSKGNFELGGVNVAVKSGYTSLKWDAKKLNESLKDNPKLKEYQKLSITRPSARIVIK